MVDHVECECLIRFLLPHRQIDDHPDDLTCDQKLWELPWADDFRLVHEDGPLSIAVCRLYVDGVDTGGKSRKKAKKVLVGIMQLNVQAMGGGDTGKEELE